MKNVIALSWAAVHNLQIDRRWLRRKLDVSRIKNVLALSWAAVHYLRMKLR